jgi:hypothetical protein
VIAIPVQALRLLAEVAVRALVRTVAAHTHDGAALGRDLETAVHLTENARRPLPPVVRHIALRSPAPVSLDAGEPPSMAPTVMYEHVQYAPTCISLGSMVRGLIG